MKRRRRADAEGADNESANGGGASEVEAVPVHAGNAGSQMRKDVHATGAGDYGDNDDETTPVDLDTAHADVNDKNADNVKDMDREEGHTSASSPQSSARKPSPLPPLKKQDEPLPASQPVKADAPQPAKSDTPLPTKQSTTAQPSRHQNQAQRTFDHASLIPAFLEESLFAPRVDAPPLVDGLVKCVADFLFQHLHLPNIEIEAKFGRIIDRTTNQRLHLPILNAAALIHDDRYFRFESDMTVDQHRNFNHALNRRVEQCRAAGYSGANVYYGHTRERDVFYGVVGRDAKVRVTYEGKTGKLLHAIEKRRVADLNIYMPGGPLDCRLSVNIETPATVPPAHQQPLFQRSKDRISYRHQIFRFDLTQVETSNTMAGSVGTGTASTTPSRHSHELELEINEVKLLQSERDKVVQGRSSGRGYLGLVQVLVNNVRQAAVMGVDVSGGADVSKNANARP